MTTSTLTPGLLFIPSHPKTISDDLYNRFYNEEHLPDVLSHDITTLIVRYKNTDPTSTTNKYIALCPVPDVPNLMSSDKIANFAQSSRTSKILQAENVEELIHFEVQPYIKTQTFGASAGRGKTLICGFIEPKEGGDEDLDRWYREEHLDLLKRNVKGYLRSTRYVRMDGKEPRFLAMHEYDCMPGELPTQEIKKCLSTGRSRRIVEGSKVFERAVFELIGEQGDTTTAL